MRQFLTIAVNAFMELVRQPIFLLLQSSSAVFIVFLASVYYFGFGDDQKMTKDSVLAVMLLTGLFGAVLCASSSLAREIRSGTALAVLAKPVGRTLFLLSKFAGLATALTLLTFTNLIAALLASRMAYDAYGEPDKLGLLVFFGCLVLAYLAGGFTNFFLRRPFVADAVLAVTLMLIAAFVVINFISKEGTVQEFAKGVDWRLVPASILILFALWILAGLAIACSTRLDTLPTLAICSALFLLGLMSDYFFGRHLDLGGLRGALSQIAYAVLPNWQLFWLADALEGQKTIPWSYVGRAFGYVVGYLGAVLALALVLFQERELS